MSLICHFTLDGQAGIKPNLLPSGGFVNNGMTNFTYNSSDDSYTFTVPAGITTGYKGFYYNGKLCQYGWNETCRGSFKIMVDKIVSGFSYQIDHNDYPVSGSAWSGNDNSTNRVQSFPTISVANKFYDAYWGSTNSNSNNTDHVALYDQACIYFLNTGTSTVTVTIQRPKWEVNNKPTPYIPNSSGTLATVSPYNLEANIAGTSYNGTKTSGCSFSTDSPRYFGSTYFDGSTGAITMTNLVIPTNFSIGGWVKWAAFNSWSRLFDMSTAASGAGYTIGVANNSTTGTITMFGRLGGSSATLPDTAIFTASLNTWYHIIATFTGASIIVYINGVATKSFTANGTIGNRTFNNLYLGKSSWPSDKYLQGYESDFRIYNTALSATEVAELYKGGKI